MEKRSMAVLEAIKGLPPGQLFPLERECAVLGRHPDCDIVLDIGAVSRQHARILKLADGFFVEDLHSRNGTFVNDQGVRGRRKLAENDRLRICDLVFVFRHGTGEATVASPPQEPGDTGAMMVDDDGRQGGSSIITSTLDVSSGRQGIRVTVNAEVKLKAILEISHNLGRTLGLGDVLPKVLDSLFAIFPHADRGFIVLRDPATKELVPKAVRHRRENVTERIRISRTIVNGVMAGKEAVLSADAATDARFDMSESIVDFHIHSMMCAPLIGSEGQVLGVIQIDTVDPRHRFGGEDLEVLASIASQAAIALENAQLHEVALQESVLQRDLALAHKVQQGFLPAAPPQVLGYEFFDFYEPANQVGGDYFDYVWIPGGRLAVAVADVAGKGISAALLMAKLSADARYCLVSEPTPAAAINRLNRAFCESRWEDRFVTLVLAVLDPLKHEVTIVTAGHMAPLRRFADGRVEPVSLEHSGGLPLGIEADGQYSQQAITLLPGDALLLYSDGVTDAMNAADQFYGLERLQGQLGSPAENVTTLGGRVLADVQRFIGTRPQSDDMCVTCFGRTGKKAEVRS
jgi:serine phosphatase RsbU (regulator of sigma subunit)/pSer/pThr/pTyr-binding forkhead associated (FHA) protein